MKLRFRRRETSHSAPAVESTGAAERVTADAAEPMSAGHASDLTVTDLTVTDLTVTDLTVTEVTTLEQRPAVAPTTEPSTAPAPAVDAAATAADSARAAYDHALGAAGVVLIQPTSPGADTFSVSESMGPVLGWDPAAMQLDGVLRSVIHGADVSLFDSAISSAEPATVRMLTGSGAWHSILVAASPSGPTALVRLAAVPHEHHDATEVDRPAAWALELVDLDPSAVLVMEFNDDSDPTSLVVSAWNPAAASLLRIHSPELAPLPLTDVFTSASTQLVRSALFDVHHTGSAMTAERLTLPELRGTVLDLRAERLSDGALALVLTDVTATASLEDRLRRDAAAIGAATPTAVTHHADGSLLDIRRALINDELEVRYQPIVELASGRVTKVQAMLGWKDRRDSGRSTELLELAEATAAIEPLTRWLLGNVAAATGWLSTRGLDVAVCAGISITNLDRAGLMEFVETLAASGELEPKRVVLQVHEAELGDDPLRTAEVLGRLAGHGFEIVVDEFGLGYATPTLLARVPVSMIKVDRSLVAGLTTVAADEAALRSVIAHGRELGRRVAAEGVGDAATLDRLRSMGCEEAQGPFLSSAVALESLPERIAELHASMAVRRTSPT